MNKSDVTFVNALILTVPVYTFFFFLLSHDPHIKYQTSVFYVIIQSVPSIGGLLFVELFLNLVDNQCSLIFTSRKLTCFGLTKYHSGL